MKKLISKIRDASIIVFVIKFIVPFLLPFVWEIPDGYISKEAKLVMFTILIIITYTLIYFFEKREKRDSDEIKKLGFIRKAYSNAHELNERKRNYIVEYSYKHKKLEKDKIAPYNIHEYIEEICHSFKNLISQITSIEKEYMSVSFVYRYIYEEANKRDRAWKWLTGRNQTMQTPLDEFMKRRDTVYHTLINDSDTFIFYNDKRKASEQRKYYMSARDDRHNNEGSILGVKLMFGNNAKYYVEGILIISTYGKKLVEGEDVDKFERLIMDDIFPNYERLIEQELGMLYLQHMAKTD